MSKRKKWIIGSSAAAILLILGIGGYYAYSILSFGMGVSKDPENSIFKKFYTEEQNNRETYAPPEWDGDERVNVLLLGGDSRGLTENEVPRSDSMLIASLDPVTKQAHLFSILRDTYVDIPDHDSTRINAALSMGGPELAMKTVSEWLDIPIQYYIYVDFEGFVKLIDAIGGIDFYVEKDMYYHSNADGPEYTIDLKEGQQHLDGKKALQYVRFRHDALSDYARTERQREFMTAVAKKLQSFSSLVRLPATLNKIEPFIETNLSVQDMWSLGNLGKKSNTNKVITAQLPPLELLREENVGGASVITVDKEQLQAFVQQKYSEVPAAESEGTGEETGSGTSGAEPTEGETGQ